MSSPEQETSEQGFVAELSKDELMGKVNEQSPGLSERLQNPGLKAEDLKKEVAQFNEGKQLAGTERADDIRLPNGDELTIHRDGYGNMKLGMRTLSNR